MKPPICVICNNKFLHSDEGGIVYFKKRKADIKWQRKMERTGSVSHPPYAEWFCGKHYEAAKELEKLTINKAMDVLSKKFSQE